MNDEKVIIEAAIIDQLEKVVEKAKVELEKIECPEHGQALNQLDFDKALGRFNIKTCCDKGEDLVNAGIAKL